jgi:hypothetical protein
VGFKDPFQMFDFDDIHTTHPRNKVEQLY